MCIHVCIGIHDLRTYILHVCTFIICMYVGTCVHYYVRNTYCVFCFPSKANRLYANKLEQRDCSLVSFDVEQGFDTTAQIEYLKLKEKKSTNYHLSSRKCTIYS